MNAARLFLEGRGIKPNTGACFIKSEDTSKMDESGYKTKSLHGLLAKVWWKKSKSQFLYDTFFLFCYLC